MLASKYRIEALLGSGGMGDVYRATNVLIGRPVAIKVLHTRHSEDWQTVERFVREAKVANIVRHRNVVDVIDVDRDDEGAPFIVQELLDGEDLAQYVAGRPEGRLSLDEVERFVLPIVNAVSHAHAAGVVHRDIKPANVFLARGRRGGATTGLDVVPKLLDFGISKVHIDALRTDVGVVLGTPAYMAPELLRGAREATPASDVWSLGVLLFEMLAGRRPFQVDGPQIYIVVATEVPPKLLSVAPHVNPEIARVVDRCLARDVEGRYPSAVELNQDLAQAVRDTLRVGPRPTPQERAPQIAKPVEQAPVIPDLDLPATGAPPTLAGVGASFRDRPIPPTPTDPPAPGPSLHGASPPSAPHVPAVTSTGTQILQQPSSAPAPVFELTAPDGPVASLELDDTRGPPSLSPSSYRQEWPAPSEAPPSSRSPHSQPSRQPVAWVPHREPAPPNADLDRIVRWAALTLVTAITMAVAAGVIGRPGGYAVTRVVELSASVGMALQVVLAVLVLGLALRSFRRALATWSDQRPRALSSAAVAGLLFFVAWQLGRAAL